MLQKIVGRKIELLSKIPKEHEKLCEVCGGIGWLMNEEKGFITQCGSCYGGIITLCPECGKPKRGVCTDDACRAKREAKEESTRYEKAIKCKYDDVPADKCEMMYWEYYGYNEGYFSEFEELYEFCYENDKEIPKYVWSTTRIEMSFDADSIVESACEELYEDAYDNIDDINELQELLDRWCAKQTMMYTYAVDYKYAIEVPEEN